MSATHSRLPIGLDAFPQALETDTMSRRFAALRVGGGNLRVSRIRLVTSKPGERAVVTYQTVGDGKPGPTLVAKVFADHQKGRRLYDVLVQLYHGGFGYGDRRVPEPLAFLDDLGMVVCGEVTGRSLDRLTGADRTAAVLAAGYWLRVLHRTRIKLDRVLDLETETRSLGMWAELVCRERPETANATESLLKRLWRMADDLEVRMDATIHKDFHYRHVLVDGTQVAVIDLDEARTGDPALDVAHFHANLRLLALSERMSEQDVLTLETKFLAGYVSATNDSSLADASTWGASRGWECEPGNWASSRPDLDDRYRFYFGHSCLKIAKQLATGRGPAPARSGPELDRRVDMILQEGLRCVRR